MKKLFLVSALFLITQVVAMQIHEYNLDLWSEDKIPLEKIAYNLLKNNPINKKMNYLVMPWSALIDRNLLHLVPDIKLNGGFTIVRSASFEKVLPILKNIGINVVFTPHCQGKVYDDIRVIPMPHMILNGADPALYKDIFYSFVGYNDSPIRSRIFKSRHPKDAVIIQRESLHFAIYHVEKTPENKKRELKEKMEYIDILSRSRFSLCPRGVGPGTLRFWESLQAQAIPVIVTDKIVLPRGFDWKSCVVQIMEKDVNRIPDILRAIGLKKEEAMKKNCLKAYKLFCGENLIKVIKDFYEK